MKRARLLTLIFLRAMAGGRRVAGVPERRGSSRLSGVVLGPDDRPVAHASVSYQSSGGVAPHVVRTDSSGHFWISKLKADDYDLRASGKGVFSEWEKNIPLRSGETKDLTLRLIYAKEVPKAYVKSKPKQKIAVQTKRARRLPAHTQHEINKPAPAIQNAKNICY